MQIVNENNVSPPEGKFWLERLLCEEQKRVFVLAILGVARSGKSSFLNAFANYISSPSCSSAFIVNAGTEPVTGGMCARKMPLPNGDLLVLLDTEGTQRANTQQTDKFCASTVELAQVVVLNVRNGLTEPVLDFVDRLTTGSSSSAKKQLAIRCCDTRQAWIESTGGLKKYVHEKFASHPPARDFFQARIIATLRPTGDTLLGDPLVRQSFEMAFAEILALLQLQQPYESTRAFLQCFEASLGLRLLLPPALERAQAAEAQAHLEAIVKRRVATFNTSMQDETFLAQSRKEFNEATSLLAPHIVQIHCKKLESLLRLQMNIVRSEERAAIAQRLRDETVERQKKQAAALVQQEAELKRVKAEQDRVQQQLYQQQQVAHQRNLTLLEIHIKIITKHQELERNPGAALGRAFYWEYTTSHYDNQRYICGWHYA